MDRREFLRRNALGAAWMAAATTALGAGPALARAAGPDVAVVKGSDPAANTRAAVEMLGGMKAFVKPGARVLIKPNMSFPHGPEMGTNTHPMVVHALAAMCREAGAESVRVLDNTLSRPDRCLERSGIRDALNADFGPIVFAINEGDFFAEAEIGEARIMPRNGFAREALRADVVIAAPTAKSHSSTGVSLGMKGMMGLVSDRYAMHRIGLDESICDLGLRLRPRLTVVDATYVLHTNGPSGPGEVTHQRTVFASRDVVAADSCAVEAFEWYGRRYQAAQVGHLRRAHERGLGRMDVAALDVRRLDLA